MSLTKKCRVCGGVASGFNYEALTCDSCKVFFCRNSPRFELLDDCENEGNCDINIHTRTRCGKCRLVKCFAVGMKRIKLSESEQQRISEPEKKTNLVNNFLEINILKQLDPFDLREVKQYVRNNMSHCSIVEPKKPSKRTQIKLSSFEQEYLVAAANAIRIFSPESTANVIQTANSIEQLIDSPIFSNLLYIKKSIQFCHNFPAFNSLSSSDQLVILKPFSLGLMQIRFAFNASLLNGILMFTDETETSAMLIGEMLGTCYQNQDFFRQMQKYTISVHKVLENDVNIRDLVTTLLLFKARQNVSNQENIRYHYCLYSLILRRYLQCKHRSRKEGNRKFLILMDRLEQMESYLSQFKLMIIAEFGEQNFPTIFREICDW